MRTSKDNENLRYSRRLSFVPRWSVMPTIRNQSVAEHSYHVTQIAVWLMTMHVSQSHGSQFPIRLLDVVNLALNHDNYEAVTGDAPSPSKPGAGANPKEADQTHVIVKVADILEAIAFIWEEERLGNGFYMESVLNDLIRRLGPWWAEFHFETSVGEDQKPKPNVRGLLAEFYPHIIPPTHPVMEGRG